MVSGLLLEVLAALKIKHKTSFISQEVKNVFGVMKAYSTKVGDGPYPTEQINDIGEIFTG